MNNLASWFNLSKKISLDDVEQCEAQMALNAYKDGIDLKDKENKKKFDGVCRDLRAAVKKHNATFHTKPDKS